MPKQPTIRFQLFAIRSRCIPNQFILPEIIFFFVISYIKSWNLNLIENFDHLLTINLPWNAYTYICALILVHTNTKILFQWKGKIFSIGLNCTRTLPNRQTNNAPWVINELKINIEEWVSIIEWKEWEIQQLLPQVLNNLIKVICAHALCSMFQYQMENHIQMNELTCGDSIGEWQWRPTNDVFSNK